MVAEYYDVMLGDKVVFVGTNLQIAKRYGMQQSFRAGHFIKQGWRLKRIYTLVPHKSDVPIITDPCYDDALWHLKYAENHNFYCDRTDKDRIVKKLAENGILVDARKTSDKKGYVLWAA